jgi:hypothetical protein
MNPTIQKTTSNPPIVNKITSGGGPIAWLGVLNNKYCAAGHGESDKDLDDFRNTTFDGCKEKCEKNLECDCINFMTKNSLCFLKKNCRVGECIDMPDFTVAYGNRTDKTNAPVGNTGTQYPNSSIPKKSSTSVGNNGMQYPNSSIPKKSSYPACYCPTGTGWSVTHQQCDTKSVTSCKDCPFLSHCGPIPKFVWQPIQEDKHCFNGNGTQHTIDMKPIPNITTINECKEQCDNYHRCKCIVFDKKSKHCWRHSNCDMSKCNKQDGFQSVVRILVSKEENNGFASFVSW